MTVDRRVLVKSALTAAGGLVFGLHLPSCAHQHAHAIPGGGDAPLIPNAWVRIPKTGPVVLILDKVEMGQGISTALATILADEMELDLDQIVIEPAPADRLYVNPSLGLQMTGGSTSVAASWNPLREAAASVRELMIEAAAKTWGTPAKQCHAQSGRVHCKDKSLAYGELTQAAALLEPPKPRLKDPSHFKLIGKPQNRVDNAAKLHGKAVFGIDVQVEGMRVAVIVRPLVLGAKVKSFDAAPAKAVPGVEQVFEVPTGVAVVANRYWQARRAADALKVTWDEEDADKLSSDSLAEAYAKAAAEAMESCSKGDGSGKSLTAEYRLPFLGHAPMEPLSCTAHVKDGSCEIWAPTQSPGLAQQLIAETTGLAHKDILVHTTCLGGGFGRRLCQDFVLEAVEIATVVRHPVKLMWSREDDVRHDWYRPAAVHKLTGAVDAKSGRVTVWAHGAATQSIVQQAARGWVRTMMPPWLPEGVKSAGAGAAVGIFTHLADDPTSVEGAKALTYDIPSASFKLAKMAPRVPVGFWRSVGHSHTAFAVESFIDELAHLAGIDPYAFRQTHLKPATRSRHVLELVAEKAGWGTALPKGVGRGIAQHTSFGSYSAQVAEVSVEGGNVIKVHRIVCAYDCGRVINPDGLEAQIQGAIVFGLSAALHGEITFKDGAPEQSNFHDYAPLRITEMPQVQVHFVDSKADPTGAGEPAVPPVAPAVANALFAASGKRLRSLPFKLS